MSPASPLVAAPRATRDAASTAAPATATDTNPNDVTMDQFLQLLVAEIQNQDPTNPMDGTAFLTQLAQFQQVEQGLTLNQDVSSILADTNTLAGADSGTAATQNH